MFLDHPGYWAKVQSGQKIKQPKLPKSNKNTKTSYTVYAEYSSEQKEHFKKKKKQQQRIVSSNGALADLKKLPEHPFISATRIALEDEDPDREGLISPRRTYRHFRLSVSESQLERTGLGLPQ